MSNIYVFKDQAAVKELDQYDVAGGGLSSALKEALQENRTVFFREASTVPCTNPRKFDGYLEPTCRGKSIAIYHKIKPELLTLYNPNGANTMNEEDKVDVNKVPESVRKEVAEALKEAVKVVNDIADQAHKLGLNVQLKVASCPWGGTVDGIDVDISYQAPTPEKITYT